MQKITGRWGAVAGTALLIAAPAGRAADKIFALDITGDQAARYTGRCIVTTATGDETLELSGVVPQHQQVTGQGLVCSFESEGSISVEISRQGRVSRGATNGGRISIAVR
jgi:hypothetical protein